MRVIFGIIASVSLVLLAISLVNRILDIKRRVPR
jgi:hypothetical protein